MREGASEGLLYSTTSGRVSQPFLVGRAAAASAAAAASVLIRASAASLLDVPGCRRSDSLPA